MKALMYWGFLLVFALTVGKYGVFGELQGPLNDKFQESESTESSQETTSIKETDKQSEDTESTITNSNERKSGKHLLDETAEPTLLSKDLETQISERYNVFQAAVTKRFIQEIAIKEKLVNEIESVWSKMLKESSQKSNEQSDPSPEEVKANSMYVTAMDMFSRPSSDRRLAYALIQKAAEMKHLGARAEFAWALLLGHHFGFNITYAISEFEDLANTGLPEANMGLAYVYSIGVGDKNVSQPLALIHFTLAALGGNTFAQMALGYRYSFGINVPINCETSLAYYSKVAKKVAKKITFSNGPAVHRIRLLDESENPGTQETEIVDYYQLLADKGDVQSQIGLGTLYYQGGKAVAQDLQKALEYFTLAANAGNAIGFAFLGKLYLEGSENIKASNETAFKFFKKAAELGDPIGQSGLGTMYFNGLGVVKDVVKALNYFALAADQGWVDGQLQLGYMYLTGKGVKTNYKLAMKYFSMASQSGNILANFYLGVMNTNGMGMLRSCPAAVEFFKNVAERGIWGLNLMRAYNEYKNNNIDKAYMQYGLLAELGYEVAQGNAAYLLDRGDVTVFNDRHEDLIRAFYYWKRAAAQGYSAAQVKLGDYYYYGWGTGVDFETAAALYSKASDQQYNAQAMFNLGYMHEQGLGMKKDWHLAKRFYDLAAETNADAKVPVAMALLKLQILANVEAIKDSPNKFLFFLVEHFSANWDLYTITILTLLLGALTCIRRLYDQYQQQYDDLAQQRQQLINLINDNEANENPVNEPEPPVEQRDNINTENATSTSIQPNPPTTEPTSSSSSSSSSPTAASKQEISNQPTE